MDDNFSVCLFLIPSQAVTSLVACWCNCIAVAIPGQNNMTTFQDVQTLCCIIFDVIESRSYQSYLVLVVGENFGTFWGVLHYNDLTINLDEDRRLTLSPALMLKSL